MNHVAEEIKSYCGSASMTKEDFLEHYGTKRHSGRYPWGSGDDPYQHNSRDFLGRIEELKKSGWTETPENIKNEFGLTTSQYRMEKSIANSERRADQVAKIKSLKEDGLGATEIGRKMGLSESTVRSLLNEKSEAKMKEAKETAEFIKSMVDKKGMIEVGAGVAEELRISQEKLNQALYLLEREGYYSYVGGVPQVTNPGQQSNQKVVCPPGTPYKIDDKGRRVTSAIYEYDKIHPLNEDQYISRDDGKTFEKKFHYPESLDSKRLAIRYKEDGGIDKDGIVEIRRGVDDLSLGESKFAQVRIMVDGKKYIKGMAVYSDDMPDGVDVIFNTNKSKSVAKMDVLKDIKSDPDNPFGSLIKDADQGGQYWYTDKNGKKKLGLINKRADEGDWDEWSNGLPSQFLSKQSLPLAKKQLDIAKADKAEEFELLRELTQPTVKKHLLNKFADECDAAAVDLKAASLPGQKYHVIIPVTSMKDTEVYAPNYENGSKLALIRYPHGGTFEIPILTVNNNQKTAKKLLGDVRDAVCINAKVAEQLSGADFDGDTVMCIPTHDRGGKVKIINKKPLEDLIGFDPKAEYGPETYKGRDVKPMKNTQIEMGKISNLITDMTLLGADDKQLARAVRHSMVVIDAEKHKLDYRQSAKDNNISALVKEWQVGVDKDGKIKYGGASTIVSKAKGEYDVLKRQGTPKVNVKGSKDYDPSRPEGALIYKTADNVSYTVNKINKRTGEVTTTTKYRTQKSTKMAETDDAYSLVSTARHPMELLYADYANSMKALANKARLEAIKTRNIQYSASAKTIYKDEVASLNDKLRTATLNAPREREANRRANIEIAAKQKAYEAETGSKMKKGDVKKISQQALTKARIDLNTVSRADRSIKITDREWEAIQAGAISDSKLRNILKNTDVDNLRERATPRESKQLTQAKIAKIKAMSASYTLQQIADKMGVSVSTISKYLKGA